MAGSLTRDANGGMDAAARGLRRLCAPFTRNNKPVLYDGYDTPTATEQPTGSHMYVYWSNAAAEFTFEEAVDVLVGLVTLHDDWLRGTPQRPFLRGGDHLHQLEKKKPQRRKSRQTADGANAQVAHERGRTKASTSVVSWQKSGGARPVGRVPFAGTSEHV